MVAPATTAPAPSRRCGFVGWRHRVGSLIRTAHRAVAHGNTEGPILGGPFGGMMEQEAYRIGQKEIAMGVTEFLRNTQDTTWPVPVFGQERLLRDLRSDDRINAAA